MVSERFSRLRLLLKDDGLARLQGSTVMVLGMGGVGSACAEALARGGVGRLLILDGDVVEESNINRQAVATLSTLGQPKTEVMTRMIADLNPDCQVEARQTFLTRENLDQTLSSFPRPDYVIDCIDTVVQKLAIARWCAQQQLPLLSSMGAATKFDPTMLRFAKIEKTTNCALSRVIRRECRVRGIRGLEVLHSVEPPAPRLVRHAPSAPKAQTLGSMSYMPPILGKMLAGKVICRLAGFEKVPRPPRLVGSGASEAGHGAQDGASTPSDATTAPPTMAAAPE